MHEMNELLDCFVRSSREILKDSLVGIYLHGSAVMGCYNPDKSDIDLIVVVNNAPSDGVKKEYMDMVVSLNRQGPKKGIEMSMVTAEVCKPFVYPTPFVLHFSSGTLDWYRSSPDDYIAKMKGTDKDLAAHFTIIIHRGKTLYGQSIEETFGSVAKEYYFDSLKYDIDNADEDIADDPMYVILNLARVLAFRTDDLILSKKEGGEWALENLPDRFHGLVAAALEEYASGIPSQYDADTAAEYAAYMLDNI